MLKRRKKRKRIQAYDERNALEDVTSYELE
jgi:hypothetical protein